MGALDSRGRRGSVGVNFGASYCNQWGLCDAAVPKLLWAGLVGFFVINTIGLQLKRITGIFSWVQQCPRTRCYLKLQTIINPTVMLMREEMFFDKRVDIWISLPEAIVLSHNAHFKRRRLAKFNLNNFYAT